MKKLLYLFLLLPFISFGGDGDISAGSCALEDSTRTEWNTAIGAAAMYGARDSAFNAAYGHRAGDLAQNCYSNVFIGVRAGKNVTNLIGSVGIGLDALRTPPNGTRTTDINGHFYANQGDRHIRISSQNNDTATPEIESKGGNVSVNGDLTIAGNLFFTNRSYAVVDKTLGKFDIYVDANRGNDEDDGSILYPKRTLQAAYEMVTNNDMRICVRAGRYVYPEWMKGGAGDTSASAPPIPYRVYTEGVDGAENTIIYRPDDTPCWMFGYEEGMTKFKGFTFTGFSRGNPNRFYWGVITFIEFEDCIFRDTTANVSKPNGGEGSAIFEQCIFKNCRIENCHFYHTSTDNEWYYQRIVFSMCYLEDCYVDYTTPVGNTNGCTGLVATQLVNCFFRCNYSRLVPRSTWNGQKPPWSDGFIYNSTILIGDSEVLQYPSRFSNSFYGISGTVDTSYINNPAYNKNSISGSYDTISGYLDGDTPSFATIKENPSFKFYGYKAKDNIETKNGIISLVADSLMEGIPEGSSAQVTNAIQNATYVLRSKITPLAYQAVAPTSDKLLFYADITNNETEE